MEWNSDSRAITIIKRWTLASTIERIRMELVNKKYYDDFE